MKEIFAWVIFDCPYAVTRSRQLQTAQERKNLK
jgi:hypothetical protein